MRPIDTLREKIDLWKKSTTDTALMSVLHDVLKQIDVAIYEMDHQEAESTWRRVEDGLPDKYTQCLVADADGKCAVGYYRYDCEAWDSPAFGWIEMEDRMYIDYTPMGIGKVVAWMPIEPPKEE